MVVQRKACIVIKGDAGTKGLGYLFELCSQRSDCLTRSSAHQFDSKRHLGFAFVNDKQWLAVLEDYIIGFPMA